MNIDTNCQNITVASDLFDQNDNNNNTISNFHMRSFDLQTKKVYEESEKLLLNGCISSMR